MLAALLTLALISVACSGGDAVDVDKQWARQSPKMATAGAVCMNLTSTDANRLIGAVVDTSIAAEVEARSSRHLVLRLCRPGSRSRSPAS
jgi:copper(I)-binding protein